jgi:hypothetical protein
VHGKSEVLSSFPGRFRNFKSIFHFFLPMLIGPSRVTWSGGGCRPILKFSGCAPGHSERRRRCKNDEIAWGRPVEVLPVGAILERLVCHKSQLYPSPTFFPKKSTRFFLKFSQRHTPIFLNGESLLESFINNLRIQKKNKSLIFLWITAINCLKTVFITAP